LATAVQQQEQQELDQETEEIETTTAHCESNSRIHQSSLLRKNALETQRQAQDEQGSLYSFAQAIRDIENHDDLDYENGFGTNKFPPPSSGIYSIVYAAEMYGRVVRSEGHVHWKFTEKQDSNNTMGTHPSFAIQGQTVTKLQQHACPITQGYWNGRTGQAYWVTPQNTGATSTSTSTTSNNNKKQPTMMLYKGTLDTRIHELFDGDFISSDGTLAGRIVRVSLVEAKEDLEFAKVEEHSKDKDTDENSVRTTKASNHRPATVTDISQEDWGSISNDIELIARGEVRAPGDAST